MPDNNTELKKVILVGLETAETADFEHSMEEMESLIEACDMQVVGILTQKLPHPEAGTYLGKGKVEELSDLAQALEAEYCIFEGNLSPAQLKNLQHCVNVPIWDRTTLILEIFSRRAKTREARLQVESAYLQYMLPRLSGMWQHLGRQGGGGGSRANKGEGETQIELDRRMINQRLVELRRELDSITVTRNTQRAGRMKGGVPRAALVGYTNAGKSTLMNRLLSMNDADADKMVFEKDMLFATLDTSIRRITVEGNKDFLLSDTVGFIENLPHGLIKAFRSTLEEAIFADIILIVLDASDPYYRQHRKVTEDTLKSLEADKIPRIYVMNKCDLLEDRKWQLPRVRDDEIWMSAGTGEGLAELILMITSKVYADNKTLDLMIPYSRGDIVNRLHEQANIISEEYTAEGIKVKAECSKALTGELKQFISEE
ncbi:MAG: GTPase HflX [Lachnospiraceae bacterium]|nr:GTPase HflX [Lachnospiraceae bacterium]